MITAFSLTQDLDKLLDPQKMSDFGANGLLILNEGLLTKVATAFTPSLEVIDEAVHLKVNALIVHHGLGEPYPIIDKPTIGLLLCKTKNNVVAEYALRNINAPIGVARYATDILKKLPKELKGSLPTVEEIELELDKQEALRKAEDKD